MIHKQLYLAITIVLTTVPSVRVFGADDWPLLLDTGFQHGTELWRTADPAAWNVETDGTDSLFRLVRQSEYKPPYRSPINIALLRYLPLTDVDMTVELRSTARDYDHRSMCLFFGYQDPSHFYYAHFGKKTDDHANQIFIVNGADRKKISLRTTSGTPWNDDWHTARVERSSLSGEIKIYFDDMPKPVMEANDSTFLWGQVGLGAFDDTGDFRHVKLLGRLKAEE